MTQRDELQRMLVSRISSGWIRRDPTVLFADESRLLARQLAEISDVRRDLDVAGTLGAYHWHCYNNLPAGEDGADLVAAIDYYMPVYQNAAAAVPEPLRTTLRVLAGGEITAPLQAQVARQFADSLLIARVASANVRAAGYAASLYRSVARAGRLADPALSRRLDALVEVMAGLQPGAAPVSRSGPSAVMAGMTLNDIGAEFLERYHGTRRVTSLETGVALLTEAVRWLPADDDRYAEFRVNLAFALTTLFEATGRPAVQDAAIDVFRSVFRFLAGGHMDRDRQAVALMRYGTALTARLSADDLGPVRESRRVWQAGVDTVATDHLLRPAFLIGLTTSLQMESASAPYAELSELLRAAAEVWADGENVTRVGDPRRRDVLVCAREAYRLAFEATDDNALLVRLTRLARLIVDEGGAARPALIDDLLVLLTHLRISARRGDAVAGREAVDRGRAAALVAWSPGDPRRAACHYEVGRAARYVCSATSDRQTLGEAERHARAAVAFCADAQRAEYSVHLSLTLLIRFQAEGDPGQLLEGTRLLREAIELCGDSPERSEYSSYLARQLLVLFEHTGDATLLAEAVERGAAAIVGVPPNHPDRPRRLSVLGTILLRSYERTGERESLANATRVAREAVRLAEAGPRPIEPMYQANLAAALTRLSEVDDSRELLAELLDAARSAFRRTSVTDLDYALNAVNYATALKRWYRIGDAEALRECVDVLRQAAVVADGERPVHAAIQYSLAEALEEMGVVTGDVGLTDEAAALYRAAGATSAGSSSLRVQAYLRASAVAMRDDRPDVALAEVEAVVELLPLAVSGSLLRADRGHRLMRFVGLPDHVVAAAVAAGRPERAVELLELTRGILVADTIAARTGGLGRLRAAQPHLADSFDQARSRLEAVDRMTPTTAHQTTAAGFGNGRMLATARDDAYAFYRETLERIRALDGFSDFMDAPRFARLSALAADGPIVLPAPTPTGCVALVLSAADQISVVRMAASAQAVHDHVTSTITARAACVDPRADRAARREAQRALAAELAWMWDAVTEPVLAELCWPDPVHTPHGEGPPRLWWCPVGIFNYLPLHAAGRHAASGSGRGPALTDYAVSSYTPTLGALRYARARRVRHTDAANVLIVAVPDAPEAPALPGVVQEAADIRGLTDWADVLVDPDHDEVCEALGEYAVVHFACHVQADLVDPAASRLLLSDHRSAPLTVAEIGTRDLNGQVAYLSACNTAVGQPLLADESLHVCGAFQMAGFASVVGSMWEVDDTTSRRVAVDFHRNLFRDNGRQLGADAAARSLHRSICDLQAAFPEFPSMWAGYMHSGA